MILESCSFSNNLSASLVEEIVYVHG